MSEKVAMTTWAGLDVAKDTFDAALYLPLENGERPRRLAELPTESFARTPDGVKSFLHWSFQLRDLAGLEGGNLRVVMEATGRYSQELTGWFNQEAPPTRAAVEDPKTMHDFIKSLKLRNKTDRLDAAAIARYGVERMPEPYEELPDDYTRLRDLTRYRLETKDQLTAARARVAELKNFPTLISIQQQLIEALEKAVAEMEAEIQRYIAASGELRQKVELARSIPGVGPITAATVFAECGPLERYTSRELSSYSGLAPVLKESGKSVRGSRISRRGPGKLRRVLYMAATSAIALNPKMHALHQRLQHKGKKPIQAHCAVMRKLLVLIRAVVVSGQKYQENFVPNHPIKA